MKSKNLVLNLLLLSVFLFSIISVSASTTMFTPVASSTVDGIVNFNVTINESREDFINLTFFAKSTLTANSTWVEIGTNASLNISSTSNLSSTNIDLRALIEDANDYIFNVTSTNQSSNIVLSEDTNTGITVDNTVPTAPSSPSPVDLGSIITIGTQTFSQTVLDPNTTSCTYTLNRDGQDSGDDSISGSSTYSGSTCSFTKAFSTSADNGNWCWTQTASDETNTSASAQACVSVGIPGANGGLPRGEFIADESGTILAIGSEGVFGENARAIWWIIGIVVAILIIWLIIWLVRR